MPENITGTKHCNQIDMRVSPSEDTHVVRLVDLLEATKGQVVSPDESIKRAIALTLAEYKALETKDEYTLYKITDIPSVIVSSPNPGDVSINPDTGVMTANGALIDRGAPGAVNLNDIIDQGLYHFGDADAVAGGNFPSRDGGMLEVRLQGASVYQWYTADTGDVYYRSGSPLTGQWGAWIILMSPMQSILQRQRYMRCGLSGAYYVPIATISVPAVVTDTSYRQLAIDFYAGKLGTLTSHQTGTFRVSIIFAPSGNSIRCQLSFDVQTLPTTANRPHFGYSGSVTAAGSDITIWLYITTADYAFMHYRNMVGENADSSVPVTVEGIITEGIRTTAPSGWTDTTPS